MCIHIYGRELLIDFYDVAFLPFRAGFPTTFLKHCGRDECPGTSKCHKTMNGGKRGHTPCKILLFQQSLFLCRLNFMEITRLSKVEMNMATPRFGDATGFKTVVSVCLSTYILM